MRKLEWQANEKEGFLYIGIKLEYGVHEVLRVDLEKGSLERAHNLPHNLGVQLNHLGQIKLNNENEYRQIVYALEYGLFNKENAGALHSIYASKMEAEKALGQLKETGEYRLLHISEYELKGNAPTRDL